MKRYSNEEWIESFKKVHNDKYDYSEMDINNKDNKGKVKIICPEHGAFWMTPKNHNKSQGCKKMHGG